MVSQTSFDVKVADEVWISAALLHREHPEREDFSIEEIVQRSRAEAIARTERPGVYVHVVQHCVANRPPNPGRYRMLFETSSGRRRLWRPGDRFDPKRAGAKTQPAREEIPAAYRSLIDWYQTGYAAPARERASDPILGLRGLGKQIWRGEDPDKYVQRLRENWE